MNVVASMEMMENPFPLLIFIMMIFQPLVYIKRWAGGLLTHTQQIIECTMGQNSAKMMERWPGINLGKNSSSILECCFSCDFNSILLSKWPFGSSYYLKILSGKRLLDIQGECIKTYLLQCSGRFITWIHQNLIDSSFIWCHARCLRVEKVLINSCNNDH